ncbi:MAG: DUF760 domain-containing protein [Geminocystis sp.]|nr:DUF760 domain-containing protein [Geminocystis sp.]HIK37796.1 DUF760 domain-containing protein [Geminocystis sp. M7585_C2015_104]MCS7149020.1 DUF760 domain-containing protein [Geminocystis sp.]MCX8078063.1 DUF760 domain-containing protein [Geminocystis sp.]MDW8114840.1 DUF760 domain-containing protein [Geminocystis sp.]
MNYTGNNPNKFFYQGETQHNSLLEYIQSLSPEVISQLSKPQTPEVFQIMERNIIGMLGTLPSEHFGVVVSTSRENLGRLLASAMMSGYFLRNAEQRMQFERALRAMDRAGEEDFSAGNDNREEGAK